MQPKRVSARSKKTLADSPHQKVGTREAAKTAGVKTAGARATSARATSARADSARATSARATSARADSAKATSARATLARVARASDGTNLKFVSQNYRKNLLLTLSKSAEFRRILISILVVN